MSISWRSSNSAARLAQVSSPMSAPPSNSSTERRSARSRSDHSGASVPTAMRATSSGPTPLSPALATCCRHSYSESRRAATRRTSSSRWRGVSVEPYMTWPQIVLYASASSGYRASTPSALSPFGPFPPLGRPVGGSSGASAAPAVLDHSLGGSGVSRGDSGVAATVDPQDLAGDVARLVPHQKGAHGRDVLRATDPSHRRQRLMVFDALAEESLALLAAQHRRVDEAGRDRVDGDPLRPELESE